MKPNWIKRDWIVRGPDGQEIVLGDELMLNCPRGYALIRLEPGDVVRIAGCSKHNLIHHVREIPLGHCSHVIHEKLLAHGLVTAHEIIQSIEKL